MKRVYLLVFDDLADWEIGLVTYELHTRNAIKVTTVGFTEEPIRTGGGLTVLPDIALSEIELDNTALFILPGGEMWHNVFDKELERVVLQLHKKGVPIAAICGATVFLAKAGIFKESIQHTSNSLAYLQSTVPDYREQAFYRDTHAVSDRGIITASGAAPVEFTYQILKTLRVYDDAILDEFAEFWSCRSK
jgi:putative intracellular protease/amidase